MEYLHTHIYIYTSMYIIYYSIVFQYSLQLFFIEGTEQTECLLLYPEALKQLLRSLEHSSNISTALSD